jgi:DNA invertase Pin-like site-specific DNA recombinase
MTTEAFPYRRYSSGKQGKGNSLARQAEPFEQLCARMDWAPNYTLNLDDKGLSAFHADHLKRGRLGFFVALAKAKPRVIQPGSVLVIENQDRLSRQEVDPARELVRELLLADVNIYDQDDNVLLTKNSLNDPLALIRLILRMERAHKESQRKSQFSTDNWKRLRALLQEKKVTKMIPYWLEGFKLDGKLTFRIVEERAAMVRDIFQWCVDGVGIATIAARLNERGQKTGHRCDHIGSSSIQKILRNRAVLGEFQPMSGRGKERKPSGKTVKDYYPRIVDDGLWSDAQIALNKRGFAQGRKSKKVNNLFERIAHNARDGYKLTFRDALPPKSPDSRSRRPNSRLLSVGAINGWPNSDYGSFTYKVVENAILRHLSELKVASVFPDRSSAERKRLGAMDDELKQIEKDLNHINDQLSEPGMADALMPAIRRLVARKNTVEKNYAELNASIVSPDADQLHTVQKILEETGGFNPTDEQTRMRLRAAIQRIVKAIWMLGVARGLTHLYAVQIDFTGGQRRSYLIRQTPTKSIGREVKTVVPGWFQSRSWTLAESRAAFNHEQPDLSTRHGVETVGPGGKWICDSGGWEDIELYLQSICAEGLDKHVFAGCDRHPLP